MQHPFKARSLRLLPGGSLRPISGLAINLRISAKLIQSKNKPPTGRFWGASIGNFSPNT